MAYLDQRRIARSPATLIGVAILEAAAIYAVISGLAVSFIRPRPAPNPLATFTPANPPKPQAAQPDRPGAHPQIVRTDPRPRDPLPPPQPAWQPSGDTGPLTIDPATGAGDVGTGASTDPFVLPSPAASPAPGFAASPARPRGDQSLWATPDDYPSRDLADGHQGLVRFRLDIGADGRVARCAITGSSGFAGLDKATCDNVARRARFAPATDETGARTPGSFAGSVRWVIPG